MAKHHSLAIRKQFVVHRQPGHDIANAVRALPRHAFEAALSNAMYDSHHSVKWFMTLFGGALFGSIGMSVAHAAGLSAWWSVSCFVLLWAIWGFMLMRNRPRWRMHAIDTARHICDALYAERADMRYDANIAHYIIESCRSSQSIAIPYHIMAEAYENAIAASGR